VVVFARALGSFTVGTTLAGDGFVNSRSLHSARAAPPPRLLDRKTPRRCSLHAMRQLSHPFTQDALGQGVETTENIVESYCQYVKQ